MLQNGSNHMASTVFCIAIGYLFHILFLPINQPTQLQYEKSTINYWPCVYTEVIARVNL